MDPEKLGLKTYFCLEGGEKEEIYPVETSLLNHHLFSFGLVKAVE